MSENENQISETNKETGKKNEKPKTVLREVWEWTYTILIAVAIAVVIKAFLFDIVQVDGLSMFPTLNDNDRLIVTKIGYKPEAGDIIILDSAYKARQEQYNLIATAEGKDSLNQVEKMMKYFSLPKQYRIKYYVKRVIAMPGQTLDIKDGSVFVDGVKLDEEYYDGTTSIFDSSVSYPITVGENSVFVMGDNRNHSKDSRDSSLGQVPYDAISGRSVFRIYPFNTIGKTE